MGRRDWLGVGLKALGVYFGVTGAADLWGVFLSVAAAVTAEHNLDPGQVFAAVLRPLAFLVAAFLLVRRTDACLRWCGEPRRPDPTT